MMYYWTGVLWYVHMKNMMLMSLRTTCMIYQNKKDAIKSNHRINYHFIPMSLPYMYVSVMSLPVSPAYDGKNLPKSSRSTADSFDQQEMPMTNAGNEAPQLLWAAPFSQRNQVVGGRASASAQIWREMFLCCLYIPSWTELWIGFRFIGNIILLRIKGYDTCCYKLVTECTIAKELGPILAIILWWLFQCHGSWNLTVQLPNCRVGCTQSMVRYKLLLHQQFLAILSHSYEL